MYSNFLKLSYLEDERSYSGALSDLACGWAGCDLGREARVPGSSLSVSHSLPWKIKGRGERRQLASTPRCLLRVGAVGGGGAQYGDFCGQ